MKIRHNYMYGKSLGWCFRSYHVTYYKMTTQTLL